MKTIKNVKWYRRLKIIDLSSQGLSVPELSQMFGLSEGTIRRYIQHFNEAGLPGVSPGCGEGRPSELTWTQSECLGVLAHLIS